MRRGIFFSAAGFVAVLIAAIATLPWWLGSVLGQVAHRWGATYGAYERISTTRFALHDVQVQRAGVHVTVSRVEADTPVVWLWHRWTGQPNEISAERWTVTVEPRNPGTAAPAPQSNNGGWVPLRATLQRIAAGLDQWLPRARIGAGTVHWPNGGLTLASATWSDRALAIEKLEYGPLKTAATLAFPVGEDVLRLTLHTEDANGTASLESHGADISGNLTWWAQPARITARFGAQGWLPTAASLQAEGWQVPGERLKLGGIYAIVRGGGKIDWQDGHLVADLTAASEPVPGKSAPPLEATLRGRGDMQAFTLEALHATLPGIALQLSAPVTIDRTGKFHESAARFTVQADLAKQPWFAAKGTVNGDAGLISGIAQSPVVDFNLEARDLVVKDIALSAATAKGRFDWPRVDLTSASLTVAGDTFTGQGGWDIRAKEVIAAKIEGKLHRATLARWLPAQPEFDVVSITAQASGPLATLAHSGEVHADAVQWQGVKPLAMTVAWHGHGDAIENFTTQATAGTTRISAEGAATRAEVRLTGLTFARGDQTHLKLTTPATVQWSPALQIDSLKLAGEGEASATIAWGQTGRLELALHTIKSTWFEELAPLPGPAWRMNALTVSGSWVRGPMAFSVNADAAIDLGDSRTAVVTLAAKGDKDGINVEALRASEGTMAVFTATGRLPAVISPGTAPLLKFETEGALAIEATTAPNAAFWEKLAELTGIQLKEPQATAHVTGTWERPLGELHLTADSVAMDPKRFKRPWPKIGALNLALMGKSDGIELTRFDVSVEGQAVRAQGRLPVPEGGWGELRKEPLAFLRRSAALHVEAADAEVAAFASFLPAYILPKGKLQVDLNYEAGGAMAGTLRLSGAASRQLGPLGVLQEINAEIQVKGHQIELHNVSAKVGGQAVALGGTIEFPADQEPRYNVTLRGDNLPFIRQTGLLIRGDLDLKLVTPATGPTAMSGSVRLRDSLFLTDVRAFLPGGPSGGGGSPPYFSVDTVPFNDWKLNVEVSGLRFMRLRTPVFTGLASAHFRFSGTLGEPHLIGDVTVDNGQVLLPFATFTVNQGSVRITEENPYGLTLYVHGTARRDDYDLSMDITGTAAKPTIVFTSSPALDSDQLLLMVMTGAIPNSDTVFSTQQRLTRVGTYLGQSLLDSFGIDQGHADRLTIISGEKISEQGRETYDVEYKLADRWKLVGEYDEFDDYNAGVKWRLFPGKPKTEKPPDAPK